MEECKLEMEGASRRSQVAGSAGGKLVGTRRLHVHSTVPCIFPFSFFSPAVLDQFLYRYLWRAATFKLKRF